MTLKKEGFMNQNQQKIIRKLKTPPKYLKKDIHHWADYLELLCMVNMDGVVSKNDFIDRIRNLAGKNSDDNEEGEKDERATKYSEKFERYANDYFQVIEYRHNAFKAYYPFKLSEDSERIELIENITNQHRFYFFLLYCSTLGYCDSYSNKLTSLFELVSVRVMKNILPSQAECFFFGSSNIEDLQSASNFYDRLAELVNTLGEHISSHLSPESLSKYHKGDGGLDIYGFVRLGDTLRHFPIYFAQCACTPEWLSKQNSSKRGRWNNFMTFAVTPLNIIFIPFSFRSANGEWHEQYKIEDSILMDRQRLIYNFDYCIDEFSQMPLFEIIDEILDCKEELV